MIFDAARRRANNNPFQRDKPTLLPAAPPILDLSHHDLSGLTNGQLLAYCRLIPWLNAPNGQQVFRLFGAAGTGKTHLVGRILKLFPSLRIALGTLSGKAALVLTRATGMPARTLHSMLYTLEGEDGDGELLFRDNPDFHIANVDLIVVDEASMVRADMARSILALGKPILVVADPFQLAPIGGEAGFMNGTVDAELSDIVRQAEHSPILELAHDVRVGRELKLGRYGSSEIIGGISLTADHAQAAEQILVGRRETMHRFNARIREMRGASSYAPEVGDKLICLRNKPEKGLFNGSMWRIVEAGAVKERWGITRFPLTMESLDFPEKAAQRFDVDARFFLPRDPDKAVFRGDAAAFSYGYAITVHKAQGSQWDDVLVIDEAFDDHAKWRYTAITRAAKTIRIVLP